MLTSFSNELKEYLFGHMNVPKMPILKDVYETLSSVKLLPITEYSQIVEQSQSIKVESIYLPESIKYSVLQLPIVTETRFNVGSSSVILCSYSSSKEETRNAYLVPFIQFMISLFTHQNQTFHVRISLYLTNFKKTIPKTKFLSKEHINSGSCMNHSQRSCHIEIWRVEELVKVLIHELIHGLQPNTLQDTPEILQFYQKRYKITSTKVKINEAYTELWANLLNCFIVSYQVKGSNIKLFKTLIGMERLFSQIQATKILNFKKHKKESDLNKHTNVLAYFVIRCEMFQKLDSFLKHCKQKNTNYIILQNTPFWEEWFLSLKPVQPRKQRLPPEFQKTLRMSSIEMKI
jgi:hypothetical protein